MVGDRHGSCSSRRHGTILLGAIARPVARHPCSRRSRRSRRRDATPDDRASRSMMTEMARERSRRASDRLDELIDVAVRLAPDLVARQIDRVAAGSRRGRASQSGMGRAAPTRRSSAARSPRMSKRRRSPIVAENSCRRRCRPRPQPADGRQPPARGGLHRQITEYNIVSRLHQAKEQQQAPRVPTRTATRTTSCSATRRVARDAQAAAVAGFGPPSRSPREAGGPLGERSDRQGAARRRGVDPRPRRRLLGPRAQASYELDVRNKSLELATKQDELTHEQLRAGSGADERTRCSHLRDPDPPGGGASRADRPRAEVLAPAPEGRPRAGPPRHPDSPVGAVRHR